MRPRRSSRRSPFTSSSAPVGTSIGSGCLPNSAICGKTSSPLRASKSAPPTSDRACKRVYQSTTSPPSPSAITSAAAGCIDRRGLHEFGGVFAFGQCRLAAELAETLDDDVVFLAADDRRERFVGG